MEKEESKYTLVPTGEATALLPLPAKKIKPITVIGTEKIRATFEDKCLQQAINTRMSPGVNELILNPDAHVGYGTPVGCVLTSNSHIYPGPIGVDIKCSMSLLQLNIPEEEIKDKKVRRALINAIISRIPTGAGKDQRSVPKGINITTELGKEIVTKGTSQRVCEELDIPYEWVKKCEDSHHLAHDETAEGLTKRLEIHLNKPYFRHFDEKIAQLGSYGGGNHFGECNIVNIKENDFAQKTAKAFGLMDGKVSFLSHCGSRGFGYILANQQFRLLANKFKKWSIPFPGNDKELVYAPLGTEEANNYLDDMALGANFATVNHLLINKLILDSFQEVIPESKGSLVYYISHNLARKEVIDDKPCWVHRKGATRAYPAGHHSLKETPFADYGHPILLPGDPQRGSAVMVALPGAKLSCYSVNHGAGRILGRKHAKRTLSQAAINQAMNDSDIISNCRDYPVDEAPDAYKNFADVVESVEKAELATTVANLKAKFVIKDSDSGKA